MPDIGKLLGVVVILQDAVHWGRYGAAAVNTFMIVACLYVHASVYVNETFCYNHTLVL